MPRRILILQGHPDPDPARLCRRLADAYADGAANAGHAVDRIDAAAATFPGVRSQAQFKAPATAPDVIAAQAALARADHLVLLFPLWLGTLPGGLKSFLEEVLRPEVAFRYRDDGLPQRLLKGRSARLVVTMGMPAAVYRWWYGAHGVRGIERNMLGFVGLAPVRRTLIGSVEGLGAAGCERWCERMRRLGAAAR